MKNFWVIQVLYRKLSISEVDEERDESNAVTDIIRNCFEFIV